MIEPQSQLRFHKAAKTDHVMASRGNVAALGFSRLPRAGFRLDLDDHHEEAMRGESNWTSGGGGDGEWAPEDDGADIWVGALTGIAAHADASEVGVGHIVVTSGRRWFLCCNLAGGRLGKPAKDYDEQGLPDILWRACPQRRCPRNNTWHRPKLFDRLRDRSVRTQCTSLSHGGARAPEKMYRPLSEDKTASTVGSVQPGRKVLR